MNKNLTDRLAADTLGPTESLGASTCWELLREVDVGRLAVVVDDAPEIFPVNYIDDHGTVVFRTADGTKLTAAANGRVAFETDGFDPDTGEAWSVVLKGSASEVHELEELVDVAHLPLAPLSGSPKNRFIRIAPDVITGRRFPVVDRSLWQNPLTLRRRASED